MRGTLDMKLKQARHISALCVFCALLFALAESASADVTIDVADVGVASGASMSVPVNLVGVNPEQIVSVEVFLTYDPAIITFDSLATTGTLVQNWVLNNGFLASVVSSGPALDTLKVAGATTVDTLTADGVLFNLDFTMGAFNVPTSSALTLEHVLFNAGAPAAVLSHGSAKVVGVDGTINSNPSQSGSNGPVVITIIDPDENRDGGAVESLLDTCLVLDPWGDASGNGQLRGFDAAEILAHVVGSSTLTGLDSLSANLDELAPFASITAFDASLVLQKRVGLIGHFPVQEKTSANHPQPESSSAPKMLIASAI